MRDIQRGRLFPEVVPDTLHAAWELDWYTGQLVKGKLIEGGQFVQEALRWEVDDR